MRGLVVLAEIDRRTVERAAVGDGCRSLRHPTRHSGKEPVDSKLVARVEALSVLPVVGADIMVTPAPEPKETQETVHLT